MDIIFLHELKVETIVGVYEWERELAQTVELNLEIGIPGPRAGASDRIGDTIDYSRVAERIRADLARQRFKLLEALAEHIAAIILNDFDSPYVKVTLAKLGMLRGVRRVGVVIERRKTVPAVGQ